MAGERIALVDSHVIGAHAVEIIVGRVVFADVIEAKAEELPLPITALRRAELADGLATGESRTAYLIGLGRDGLLVCRA